jgi:hypothetical protein
MTKTLEFFPHLSHDPRQTKTKVLPFTLINDFTLLFAAMYHELAVHTPAKLLEENVHIKAPLSIQQGDL